MPLSSLPAQLSSRRISTAGPSGSSLAFTGDSARTTGRSRPRRHRLLAEASYAERVPDDVMTVLSGARDAGSAATRAGVGRLLLTHLVPDTDAGAALRCDREAVSGQVDVVRPGFVLDL